MQKAAFWVCENQKTAFGVFDAGHSPKCGVQLRKISGQLIQPETRFAPPEMSRPIPSTVAQPATSIMAAQAATKISFVMFSACSYCSYHQTSG